MYECEYTGREASSGRPITVYKRKLTELEFVLRRNNVRQIETMININRRLLHFDSPVDLIIGCPKKLRIRLAKRQVALKRNKRCQILRLGIDRHLGLWLCWKALPRLPRKSDSKRSQCDSRPFERRQRLSVTFFSPSPRPFHDAARLGLVKPAVSLMHLP